MPGKAGVKERFLAVWNGMAANRDQLIADCRAAKAVHCDCAAIDAEMAELSREIEVVTDLSRKAIHEIARNAADQEGLNERNNGYLERHCKATERKAALEAAKRQRKSRARILETYLSSIASSPLMLTEFDEKLWTAAIDRVTVMLDDRFVFRFKDGTEVEG